MRHKSVRKLPVTRKFAQVLRELLKHEDFDDPNLTRQMVDLVQALQDADDVLSVPIDPVYSVHLLLEINRT